MHIDGLRMQRIFFKTIFFIALSFFSTPLFSAQEPSVPVVIQGIALVSPSVDPEKQIEGVQFLGVDIPGDPYELQIRLRERFIGQPITRGLFAQIRSEITAYYSSLGEESPPLLIPYQDLTKGVIRIVISTCEDQDEISDDMPIIVPDAPKEMKVPRYSREPIIACIQAVLLIPNQNYVNSPYSPRMRGLQVHDVVVPGGLKKLREELECCFLNQPLTKDLIRLLKEKIVLYYRNNNRPVVTVYVPEQEVVEGVLQLVVMEGHVGQVATSGGRWFSNWMYEQFFPLKPGDPIASDTLLTYVSWLNRNPFRNVDVVFTPGAELGLTNIEFAICDRFPVQVYVGGDNTGTEETGEARLFAGATWGNAFFLDHILNYQYTTSYDLKKYQSHTGHYTIPLVWRNLLILFGGYSTVKPDLDDENFSSDGHFTQASIRYVIPVGKNYDGSLQELSAGFDFKNYNSNLFFIDEGTVPLITQTVNLSQFTLGYALGKDGEANNFWLNLDLYGSPGALLPDETEERYDQLTPGATVQYIYGLLTMGNIWYWPYWPCGLSLYTLGRLQISNQALLPSERFAIGGYETVRGYLEREFNADDALVLNVEIRTPSLHVLPLFHVCNVPDDMYFLLFFDYGIGHVIHENDTDLPYVSSAPNIGFSQYLMSTGIGWRYTINRYLSARVDWGIKLHHSLFSDGSRSRFHVGVVLSY